MASVFGAIKWFYPGMRVKRWAGLAAIGFIVGLFGISLALRGSQFDLLFIPSKFWNWIFGISRTESLRASVGSWLGAFVAIGGFAACSYGGFRLVQSVRIALNPSNSEPLVDTVYRHWFLAQGARIVVIGGGTGLSTMLRGLKRYSSNIVAVVTVSDDGGSSGRLTRQLNMLPPGDIRNCLVALADSEATMTDLFQYRFRSAGAGEGLRDHAFGNLLIAAMCDISGGDFEQAVRLTSQVLNIRGRVLPSTLTHVTLKAEMEDGSEVEGETNIAHSPLNIHRVSLNPADAEPLDEVLEAIDKADIIVIGPGSVFTSVIPNLLVRGIPEALHKARAKKVYICNVMTQPGETDHYTAADHLKAIEAHVPRPVLDYILLNTAIPTTDLIDKYRQTGSQLVLADVDRIRAMGYKAVAGDFVSQTDVVRHDPAKLAEAIMKLVIRTARQ